MADHGRTIAEHGSLNMAETMTGLGHSRTREDYSVKHAVQAHLLVSLWTFGVCWLGGTVLVTYAPIGQVGLLKRALNNMC